MKDYGLREVVVGDIVINGQGKLYQILPTDETIAFSGVAYANEVRITRGKAVTHEPRLMVRVSHTFRLSSKEKEHVFNWQAEDRVRYWQTLHKDLVSERGRKEAAERKAHVQSIRERVHK